ncbi:glycogen synthase [Kitasatospora sp. GP82]|uniref:glycogen synthase n=1 Tax=Kitasatospora sp. GP82 TaxID=3035089 RepID=UPI002476FFEA|nr:glycogen synthase [Kitasatospora sp. GP82]MDH6128369.1 starch synthase [Kitasatospora sp. GP82]
MRVDLLTREYPPFVYGGAGEHVGNLARQLRRSLDIRVHCFGEPRLEAWVTAHGTEGRLADGDPALGAMAVNLAMSAAVQGASVVHSHTWYSNFAGHLAKVRYGIPHVVTAHSLEPLRPWKKAQLGDGYRLSSFLERTALSSADHVIAVSAAMAADVLRTYPNIGADRVSVIHNGIDVEAFAPDSDTDQLDALGIPLDRPLVVCVARITRQKGLGHLLRAAQYFAPGVRLVVVAQSADTVEQRQWFGRAVERLRGTGVEVTWIRESFPRCALRQLLSHAEVFVCPSIYEPMGIVNLEAMACGTPVVATATGGIPEVVVDGETGLLVPFDAAPDGTGEPAAPEVFAKEIAARVNELLHNPASATRLGTAGRRRAAREFSWPKVAEQVRKRYATVR